MPKARRKPRKPAQLPWGGDHGSQTPAATAGTVLEPVEGSNPNRIARRRRIEHWETMGLSLRQHAAAKRIRDASCAVEMLSSGDALKEQVDTSSRPDDTIDVQTDVQSALVAAMQGIPAGIPRKIVEAILWRNEDPNSLPKAWGSVRAQFKISMDLAENRWGARKR